MSIAAQGQGRIITFYSYKGGTGRSMAVANAAWILASCGNRVLIVDWDLEAPGLHRYFAPFLVDKDLSHSDGIINFVTDYKLKALTPPPKGQELPSDWFVPYANILHYACAVEWDFGGDGRLDLVPAGRQDSSYSELVNGFDWRQFYERLGGAQFMEATKTYMRQNYHYTLIDSRTGVSDTSGICTIVMPDDLVICYTLNNQSIKGASAIAADAKLRRKDLRIFPVPMRVDPFEKVKLDLRRQLARQKFSDFPDHLNVTQRETYHAKSQVPYIPYYAYEEILATFGDTVPPAAGTLLESIERIVADLTSPEYKATAVRESTRLRILAEFEGSGDEELIALADDAFESLTPEQRELAQRILTRLVRLEEKEDKTVAFSVRELDAVAQEVLAELRKAGLVVVQQDQFRLAKDSLLRSWKRLREWIDDDREFLLWRQSLWKISADWRESRDRKLLLKGSAATDARHWLSRRRKDLLPVEMEYIEASLRQGKMRERVLTGVGMAVVLIAIVALSFWFGDRQWKQFAAEGSSTGAFESMEPISQGLLLTGQTGEARVWDAKRQVVSFSTLVSDISAAPFPQTSILVSRDGTGALINAATGKVLLNQLKGNATFDQSGRFVWDWDSGTMRIWRVGSTTPVGTLKVKDRPRETYVTEKGDRVVFNDLNSLLLGNIDRGSLVAAEGHSVSLSRAFDVDERNSIVAELVTSYGKEGYSVILWDLSSGNKIREFVFPGKPSFSAGKLEFSDDGQNLLLTTFSRTGDGTGAFLGVSDFASPAVCPGSGPILRLGRRFYVACAGSPESVVLWDGNSPPKTIEGLSMSTLQTGSSEYLLFAGLGSNGSRLLIIRNTRSAGLWDFNTGKKINDLNLAFRDSSGNQVTDSRAANANFTMDDRAIAVRLESGAILLYSADKGFRIALLDNAGGTKQSVYYDAECQRVNVWTDTGRVLRYVEGRTFFSSFIPVKKCQ